MVTAVSLLKPSDSLTLLQVDQVVGPLAIQRPQQGTCDSRAGRPVDAISGQQHAVKEVVIPLDAVRI